MLIIVLYYYVLPQDLNKDFSFYDYYNIGIEGDNELVHSHDINNYDTSHLLDPKKLEFIVRPYL